MSRTDKERIGEWPRLWPAIPFVYNVKTMGMGSSGKVAQFRSRPNSLAGWCSQISRWRLDVIRSCKGSNSWGLGELLKLSSLFAAMVLLGIGVAVAAGGGAPQGAFAWKAPAAAEKVKNPVPPTKGAIAAGKRLFDANCSMCHGQKGEGDGPVAAGLSPKPANFTDAKLMSLDTDGGLFWKITHGNSPMPAWDALPAKQRWELIDYIRTFAKQEKKEK